MPPRSAQKKATATAAAAPPPAKPEFGPPPPEIYHAKTAHKRPALVSCAAPEQSLPSSSSNPRSAASFGVAENAGEEEEEVEEEMVDEVDAEEEEEPEEMVDEEEEPEEIEEEEEPVEELEGEEEVLEEEIVVEGEVEDAEGEEGAEGRGDEVEEGKGKEEERGKAVPRSSKEKTKQKEYEVFVGGLPRDATEEDLEKVFNKVGEVVEVRLVKQHNSWKNKGFAFVRYANVEQARKASVELRHTRVKGKPCGVLRSKDKETLHLGNICTTWTKDDLVEKLDEFELENLEEIHLIEDSRKRGRNRGYAFLDFSTHMDAVSACSKLQRGNAYFGTDVRAEVSFSKTVEPDEEVMAQVKSVFVDGLPSTWDEAEVWEHFEKFGEIESVQLASHMLTAKRKDFGFISFATRKAALDCIEKVNRDGIREGAKKVSVKATLKKPLQKRMSAPPVINRGYLGKSFSGKGLPYGIAGSYASRYSRTHEVKRREHGDGMRRLVRFSSKTSDLRMASPTLGNYGAQPRSRFTRELRGPPVAHSRYRNSYLESGLLDEYASGSHQDLSAGYARYEGPYSNVDTYDLGLDVYENRERDSYNHPSVSRIKRPYSDVDGDLLPPYSHTKHVRSRSNLEIYACAPHRASSYDEYPRIPVEDHFDFDRNDYVSRDYGSRYSSGTGTFRPYY